MEAIKETNSSTDFFFLYINKLKGKYAQYKCVSCYSVNVSKNHGDVTNSTQKRSKFTGDYPRTSVTSIKLQGKNSYMNLHFRESRLVWMVLRLKL